jgi:hypothetical protein
MSQNMQVPFAENAGLACTICRRDLPQIETSAQNAGLIC